VLASVHLPHLPTREEISQGDRRTLAKDTSLDEIVGRAMRWLLRRRRGAAVRRAGAALTPTYPHVMAGLVPGHPRLFFVSHRR